MEFSGTITDTTNLGLQGANILLIPEKNDTSPAFGATDVNGDFSIQVKASTSYQLTISYIGFKRIDEMVDFGETDLTMNFTLQEAANELEEVVLRYIPPIEYKKDTTVYKIDSFATGKERKLKEILNVLPGIEVNRDGDVFFNNKKVSKVLVENKTFFNGRSKLAVENIPASVVEEIELIEDYSETEFLKEFLDSDELAMNIVLRDDRKKFVFGDIEAGAGYEDRYRLHPSLFRYSPKFVTNLIGDFNNTYTRSFTLADYFSMEGLNDASKLNTVLNSSVARFLGNEDFFANDHRFIGLNNQWNPNETNELRLFVLSLNDNIQSENIREFIYQANQSREVRTLQNLNDNRITYGKLHYRYVPNKNFVLKLSGLFEDSELNIIGDNQTQSELLESDYQENFLSKDQKAEAKLEINKYFSEKNTATLSTSIVSDIRSFNSTWDSDIDIFPDTLAIVPSNKFVVNQKGRSKFIQLGYELKDYYRPTPSSMISFEISGDLQNGTRTSSLFQIDSENQEESEIPFSNDLSTSLNDIITTISYKKFWQKINLSFALNWQHTYWINDYRTNQVVYSNKAIYPSFKFEWNPKDRQRLGILINRRRRNPNGELFLLNPKLSDFNVLRIGEAGLEQFVNDRILLTYSSIRSYGLSLYGNLGARIQRDQIISAFNFNGINGEVAPIQINSSNVGYDALFRLTYNKPLWRMTLTNNFYYKEFPSVFNGIIETNLSRNLLNALSFRTRLEQLPDFEITIQNNMTTNSNASFSNRTNVLSLDAEINYDIGNLKFLSGISQTWFNNITQSSRFSFNQINASAFYHKEHSKWEFGIDFQNLGNTRAKTINFFNPTRFTNEIIRVFPRTILLNIYYKL